MKISNKILMIIRGLVVFFLFFNSVYLQYIPLLIFKTDVNSIAGNMKVAVLLSTFSDLIILAIILSIYFKELVLEFKKFIKNIGYNLGVGALCWIVGLSIMFASNIILVIIFRSQGANNEILVRSMINSLPLVMGLNVCLLAPFIEEVVFRKTIKDVFSKVYLFVPIAFLTFGIAHVSSMATSLVDWLYIVPYGALGGAFAFAYYKTDTIFTSLTFHMLHNVLVFILILMI